MNLKQTLLCGSKPHHRIKISTNVSKLQNMLYVVNSNTTTSITECQTEEKKMMLAPSLEVLQAVCDGTQNVKRY